MVTCLKVCFIINQRIWIQGCTAGDPAKQILPTSHKRFDNPPVSADLFQLARETNNCALFEGMLVNGSKIIFFSVLLAVVFDSAKSLYTLPFFLLPVFHEQTVSSARIKWNTLLSSWTMFVSLLISAHCNFLVTFVTHAPEDGNEPLCIWTRACLLRGRCCADTHFLVVLLLQMLFVRMTRCHIVTLW